MQHKWGFGVDTSLRMNGVQRREQRVVISLRNRNTLNTLVIHNDEVDSMLLANETYLADVHNIRPMTSHHDTTLEATLHAARLASQHIGR